MDWKCLSGDSSDNIPGMPGIGASKAKKLINQFDVLEKIPNEYLIKDDIDYKEKIEVYKRIIKLPFNYN